MRRILIAPVLTCMGFGCVPSGQFDIEFSSETHRDATATLRAYLFGAPSGAPPTCAELDPRGAPPGDAEARSGLSAVRRTEADRSTTRLDFSGAPDGTYTLIVEAWGPPCRSGPSGPCAEFEPTEATVMRSYFCRQIEIGGPRSDALNTLEPLAKLGVTMNARATAATNVRNADSEEDSLLIADGQAATQPFLVQLLDNADEIDGVKVRFEIERGRGRLTQAQPVLSGLYSGLDDTGIASAYLYADPTASELDGGRIVVRAHAAGFDGSPVRFYARSIRGVVSAVEVVDVPRERASMQALDARGVPVALQDLDGDLQLDLVTVAGGEDHQLVVHYANQPEAHVSAPSANTARAFTIATLGNGAPTVIVSSAQEFSDTLIDVGGGDSTFVVQQPRLEFWEGLERPRTDFTLDAPTRILEQIDGVPISKVAIAMTARDLDGDGVDEVAATRCSWLLRRSAGQDPFVSCMGNNNSASDSEATLFKFERDELTTSAVIPKQDNTGGYREIALPDLDSDGGFDLIFASEVNLHGVCGSRFQGAVGFGFDGADPVRTNTTIAGGFSVAIGAFDDVPGDDVAISGSLKSNSPAAWTRAFGTSDCVRYDTGRTALNVGAKTAPHLLSLRAADLNRDGYDDLILLHREDRRLRVFLSGGQLDFAAGPVISLPAGGDLGQLAVGEENGQITAATVAPRENRLIRVRFWPQ